MQACLCVFDLQLFAQEDCQCAGLSCKELHRECLSAYANGFLALYQQPDSPPLLPARNIRKSSALWKSFVGCGLMRNGQTHVTASSARMYLCLASCWCLNARPKQATFDLWNKHKSRCNATNVPQQLLEE
eukprot:3866493-Amphidinium_carterae.1